MNTIDSIPVTKLSRAGKLITTGAKVGGNYLKYYSEKMVNPSLTREKLNEKNAGDIYDGLKQLKGSALKVAQMLSMEKNIMPKAYVEKFSLAQFSVPPLSAPLVKKTFKKYFGKYPEEIFDTFNAESVNAASIGQVHRATLDGKKIAVKIQYPGVAQSISSDLSLVKSFALKMFNIQAKDSDKYFKEVEEKLTEETDYLLEIERSIELSEACAHLQHLRFPQYYRNLSCESIIAMDWMEGKHLSEFTAQPQTQEIKNQLSQALWDFYMYQMHVLRKVHADPHPGNFLINDQTELVVIDFGCIKEIPESFYKPYFELADFEATNSKAFFETKLEELEILKPEDTTEERTYFSEIFHEMLSLFTKPFNQEVFDFSDNQFFNQIVTLGEKFAKDTQLRKMNGNRGSKHFLYINRTFFGLYNLLHDLGGKVQTKVFEKYKAA